ncbi:quinone oxidoreductase [Pseudomonas sp. S34]|uniref:quinone oxidoreductase family protein n=1 Tax=Pseudomonas sp. S34 TaxID=1573718 RepID=UPI000FC1320C|nr:zinc-binding alcohol dehydrogenase family protein [Pseudomonas sp. S34]QHF40087.1 quinone oxidoreductase [Pseudomonas sp. S34]
MKALVAIQLGAPPQMQIEDRAMPVCKPGYTLVKIHASTVNPLSNQVRTGFVAKSKAPLVLSNDGSGVVEQSDRFKSGTRVAIYGGAQLGITEDGLQQQWALVEDKRIIELPASFDLDEGAALPINYVTAHQALTRVAQVKRGQLVLISGASGALGQALIQMSKALGAVPIAIVSTTAKIERARQAGAEVVIDLSKQKLLESVLAATNGEGAHLAFDPVGGALLGELISGLRTRGAVISIGFAAGTTATFDVPDVVIYEKRILGYDAWLETDEDVANALQAIGQFINEGKLRPHIDSVFPMDQYAEAYQRLTSRQATGAVLLRC